MTVFWYVPPSGQVNLGTGRLNRFLTRGSRLIISLNLTTPPNGWLMSGKLWSKLRNVLGFQPARQPERSFLRKPADGLVDIVPIPGFAGEPNLVDSRFARFVGRDETTTWWRFRNRHRPPPLLGRVVMMSVFVGRDGESWTDAELAQGHRSLIRAGEWIEREAIRWSSPVNVSIASTYFAADDPIQEVVNVAFAPEGIGGGPFEADASVKGLAGLSRVAAWHGFDDAADLGAEVAARVEAEAVVWLLHLRRAGRSHAVRADDGLLPGVSLAVCYAREANFPEPLGDSPPFVDPTTVVHEVLHLFGANDKYGVSLSTFPPRSVTARDIMKLASGSLSQLRVDPLTARELGWLRA